MMMFWTRRSFWGLIIMLLSLLLSVRMKAVHEETLAQGLVWGGWSKGYYYPRREGIAPPPPNYYKILNLKPGAPMQFVKQRCDERLDLLAFVEEPTEREQRRMHDVREGCRILTIDYERCYYDAGKSFRSGLWEGYFAECNYLEELATRSARMDRKRENWVAQGFEGEYLEAREKAEAHRDDLRIAVAKDLADEALAQEKIKRRECKEKKRNEERSV